MIIKPSSNAIESRNLNKRQINLDGDRTLKRNFGKLLRIVFASFQAKMQVKFPLLLDKTSTNGNQFLL
jgi:hypothetical protein